MCIVLGKLGYNEYYATSRYLGHVKIGELSVWIDYSVGGPSISPGIVMQKVKQRQVSVLWAYR